MPSDAVTKPFSKILQKYIFSFKSICTCTIMYKNTKPSLMALFNNLNIFSQLGNQLEHVKILTMYYICDNWKHSNSALSR